MVSHFIHMDMCPEFLMRFKQVFDAYSHLLKHKNPTIDKLLVRVKRHTQQQVHSVGLENQTQCLFFIFIFLGNG